MVLRRLLLVSVALAGLRLSSAVPVDRNVQQVSEYDDPDLALVMLSRLLHTSALESLLRPGFPIATKRALDLGLGRGFSGSQAAKHLMGLSAANFAGGPGRRKRQTTLRDAIVRGESGQLLRDTIYQGNSGESAFLK